MKPFFIFLILLLVATSCRTKIGEYVCKPCNLPCDELSFESEGECPHCNMPLILRSELQRDNNLEVNEIVLYKGSGNFKIDGGPFSRKKTITVYYYKPNHFNATSKILFVIPGAGRNGDSYRDAWINEAEKHNLLVLSPKYDEKEYAFEQYHLGGILSEIDLKNRVKYEENSNIALLNEDGLDFQVNTNTAAMLFPDFDRIFGKVVDVLESSQESYDIFGHSAGGQILHRMALFYPLSKANRIIAANSGFYTLPNPNTSLPFGIRGTSLNNETLKQSFKTHLTVLVGEQDNEHETGGTLLRSKTADLQGMHRLARAKYFYKTAKALAKELHTPYNWQLEIVPQVGHDHEKMGDYAAKLLYEKIDEN